MADEDEHFPWHYTEFGVECVCGLPMDRDERCEVLRLAVPVESPSNKKENSNDE